MTGTTPPSKLRMADPAIRYLASFQPLDLGAGSVPFVPRILKSIPEHYKPPSGTLCPVFCSVCPIVIEIIKLTPLLLRSLKLSAEGGDFGEKFLNICPQPFQCKKPALSAIFCLPDQVCGHIIIQATLPFPGVSEPPTLPLPPAMQLPPAGCYVVVWISPYSWIPHCLL